MTHPGKCLNNNMLKLIAVISMVIDHTAVVLIENRLLGGPFYEESHIAADPAHLAVWQNADRAMRYAGRLAFPIFCYLMAEGFLHTRDVKKYAKRLLLFALISEIPFDLAAFGTWFYPGYQNVYLTLLLGLLAIAGIYKYQQGKWWQQAAVFIGCSAAAWLLKCDYGAFGVFFMVVLYLFHDNEWQQTMVGSLCLMWEPAAMLAFIPIRMYNGARGDKKWKWFFYGFYPAHLLVLVFISRCLYRTGF